MRYDRVKLQDAMALHTLGVGKKKQISLIIEFKNIIVQTK